MNNSRISVCLPNYNHSRYLPGAVEALMAQSHRPHEIIIVDDASTDDSVRVIEALCSKHPSILFLQNEVNQGCCRSTNRAIAAATGDFLFNTAADDLVLPGYFEKAVASLKKYPRAGVCVTQIKYIDHDGSPIPQEKLFHRFSPQKHIKIRIPCLLEPDAVITRLKRQPWFLNGGPSPLYRREVILDAGGWHDELGPYTDWFNVHFAALKYGVVYVPEPLVAFRVNLGGFGEAATRNPFTAIEMLGKCLALMRSPKFREVFPSSFVHQKESDFAYFALAGSLNGAYRNFRLAADHFIPPTSAIDRTILFVFGFLHQAFKVVLLIYCRWKGKTIQWPVEARASRRDN